MNNLTVWLGFLGGIVSTFLFLFLVAAIVSLSGTKLQEVEVQFVLPSDGLQVGTATDIKIKEQSVSFTFEGKRYVIPDSNVVFWKGTQS